MYEYETFAFGSDKGQTFKTTASWSFQSDNFTVINFFDSKFS